MLANSIKVLVEGPNESRQWVDMPVPEPVFDLSMKPSSDARALFSEPTDRDDLPQEKRERRRVLGGNRGVGLSRPGRIGAPVARQTEETLTAFCGQRRART